MLAVGLMTVATGESSIPANMPQLSRFTVCQASRASSCTGNGPFWGLVYAPEAFVSYRGQGASGGFNGALAGEVSGFDWNARSV